MRLGLRGVSWGSLLPLRLVGECGDLNAPVLDGLLELLEGDSILGPTVGARGVIVVAFFLTKGSYSESDLLLPQRVAHPTSIAANLHGQYFLLG